MKNIKQALYTFSLHTVLGLSLLLCLLLTLSGLAFTAFATDMTSQRVLFGTDSPLATLAGLSAAALVLFAGSRIPPRVLLPLSLGVIGAAGLFLVVWGKTVPAADSMSVYSVAEALAAGDLSVIHPTDSYLSYYPQQVGLVAYYECVIRLWRLLPLSYPAYHIIKVLNILWAWCIVMFQYRSLSFFTESPRVKSIYLILAACNLPLIFYTSFVYGEIPSFALFSMGLWAALALIFQKKPLIPLCLLGICGSVFLRKNSLILVIALLLALGLQWLISKRKDLLCLLVLLALCSFAILPLTQRAYELRAGSSLSSGVPPVSYFAMGMQEASRAEGWYNGFNFNTYRDTGMDARQTARISRAAIEERARAFLTSPSYALRFYSRKYLSQWTDGTYACRQATLATFGGRSSLVAAVYEGRFSPILIACCNIYQNLLYAGALLYLLFAGILPTAKKTLTRGQNLPLLILYICVIGGFLFHMLWEANSRYVLPYAFCLLPYAALGIAFIFPAPRSQEAP